MMLSLNRCLALGLAIFQFLTPTGAAPAPLAINPTTMISSDAELRLSNSPHHNFARDVSALVRLSSCEISPSQILTDLKAKPTSEECSDKFQWSDRADTGRMIEGINYLEGLNQDCVAKPKSTQRISCSWGVGIWLENKNDKELRVPCSDIGKQTRSLMLDCLALQSGAIEVVVFRGHYDSEGYTITGKHGSC
jgi:hypothetical protein